MSVAVDSTTAFFIHGGRRTLDERIAALEETPAPEHEICRVLEVATVVDWSRATYSVYVVELKPDVFKVRKFFEGNLDYREGTKPCIYVGMTGLTPEERFRRHLAGIQASSIVRRYGLRLCPGLYVTINPMPHDLAKQMESWLSQHLRSEGYGVWQN